MPKDFFHGGLLILNWRNNVRDYATINELTVLSNLETHIAQMIRDGRLKEDRFAVLKEIF